MLIIRRALLVVTVLAAPACVRWEGARTPGPVADHPAEQAASGLAAPAADAPAARTPDAIGQRPVPQPAQVAAADRRAAGPLATVAVIAVVAAGAFAVLLLLAHVTC